MTLYLYRLTRIGGVGYDECAGFVVAAPDEARARSAPFCAWVAPDADGCADECRHVDAVMEPYLGPQTPCAWEDPARTTCVHIGRADDAVPQGVVLRAFNAG